MNLRFNHTKKFLHYTGNYLFFVIHSMLQFFPDVEGLNMYIVQYNYLQLNLTLLEVLKAKCIVQTSSIMNLRFNHIESTYFPIGTTLFVYSEIK